MKTLIKILLGAAIVLLTYLCIMSIVTPIQFDEEKARREVVVIEKLVDIRKAEVEYKDQKGVYTDKFDELIKFLQTSKKKTVLKEGSLNEKQLEAGLTEAKAAAIVRKGNKQEISANGLDNFRRDTAYVSMIEALYLGKYTAETIEDIKKVPFTTDKEFVLKVDNNYTNSNNIKIPLFEASVLYEVYLADMNRQEILNKIDVQTKLAKFPGLMVGSIMEPNNNAGNWE
jgi:hypothetical protein